MKKYILILILSAIIFSSCEKAFVASSPDGNSSVEVFEEFWNLYNDKYAMFEAKGVDWKAEYDANKLLVNENTSQDQLFEIMSDMVLKLKDGHSNIIDLERDSVRGYDILAGAPLNFDLDQFREHIFSIQEEEAIAFAQGYGAYLTLKDNIGYILISSFNVDIPEDLMNTILNHFKDTKGLIIDVRNNGGGDPGIASLLASHLTDKEVSTGFERFKTGPGPNDFTDSPAFNTPAASGEHYTKPIMILTNGISFSATTTFIYQMNPLDHVTFIGSRTGGGSGSVAEGFLSNGWKYALSTSEFIDNEGRHLDNGIDPDIEVWLDLSNGQVDEVIQRAIDELNK